MHDPRLPWPRISGALATGLLLAGAPGALQESSPAAPQGSDDATPAEASLESAERGPAAYRFLDDAEALLNAWQASGLAEPLELGTSRGGRPLVAVQFGGAGELPLAERTTLVLTGGLDGISMAGSEALVQTVDALLAEPDALPGDAAFLVLPWANPDGLARWLQTGCADGRNDRPWDDDGDGFVDEDGFDDVDGNGTILEMLLEDPRGEWVRGSDGRLLLPAIPGSAPRFLRTREGEDRDGDGRYNEDPPGGVVIDRNFPLFWRGPWAGMPSGDWPLSEPEAASLAELALRRRVAVFIAFQGNHGHLAGPGGVAAPPDRPELGFPCRADAPAFDAALEAYRSATGRPQERLRSLREAYGSERPGSAQDWFYGALGALALELAVWGPGAGAAAAGEAGLPSEAAWLNWLDETRGGVGFVPWQPLELRGGKKAWVGGWEPHTCFNPPPQDVPALAQGLAEFCRALARDLPRLSLDLVEKRRDGRLVLLRARLKNQGRLPSGVGPGGAAFGARVRVEVPAGVELLAGERVVRLEHVPGQGQSSDIAWLFSAPEGTLFQFELSSRWVPPQTQTVRF